MDFSLVIPAYNEEKRLEPFLRTVLPYLRERFPDRHEILVVDDGSVDATAQRAAALVGDKAVLRLGKNCGKGAAVRAGMLKTTGKWRLFSDADGATPITEIDRLMTAVERTGADVVVGSRAAFGGSRHWSPGRDEAPESSGGPPRWHVRRHRHFTGRVFSFFVRAITGLSVRDTQCGFKLFRGDAADKLFSLATSDRFAFDVEVLYLATKLRYQILEVPVHWHEVAGSKVRLFRDATQMLGEVASIRFRHRSVTRTSPRLTRTRD